MFMIALPEETLKIVQSIGEKLGMREAQVISAAIEELNKKVEKREANLK